jgi:hypothetical protein
MVFPIDPGSSRYYPTHPSVNFLHLHLNYTSIGGPSARLSLILPHYKINTFANFAGEKNNSSLAKALYNGFEHDVFFHRPQRGEVKR